MVAILVSLASTIARGTVGEDATERARCKETSSSFSFLHPVVTNTPRHARGGHREENGNPILYRVDSGFLVVPPLWDPVSDQEGLGDLFIQVGLGLRPCKNKLLSGMVAQLVVYLTSRHKALALTPSTA